MANTETELTPQQKLEQSLGNVVGELWKAVSARFATKQETGTDYEPVSSATQMWNNFNTR